MPSSMYKLLLPVVCFPRTARNENRSATPSATDVTPTRHVGVLLALLHQQVRTELSVVIIDSQSVKTVSK